MSLKSYFIGSSREESTQAKFKGVSARHLLENQELYTALGGHDKNLYESRQALKCARGIRIIELQRQATSARSRLNVKSIYLGRNMTKALT